MRALKARIKQGKGEWQMSNPTVILNGDQVYCDELIRENARLTIQHEADRQKMEALRSGSFL